MYSHLIDSWLNFRSGLPPKEPNAERSDFGISTWWYIFSTSADSGTLRYRNFNSSPVFHNADTEVLPVKCLFGEAFKNHQFLSSAHKECQSGEGKEVQQKSGKGVIEEGKKERKKEKRKEKTIGEFGGAGGFSWSQEADERDYCPSAGDSCTRQQFVALMMLAQESLTAMPLSLLMFGFAPSPAVGLYTALHAVLLLTSEQPAPSSLADQVLVGVHVREKRLLFPLHDEIDDSNRSFRNSTGSVVCDKAQALYG
ncbi:hypothetical protein M514_10802 [Trichuris suis]|uniref:Uncharacterized protein n=1 Tax=Trichuris suis TaxID=68888 RepID=A0A085N4S7_9BILA|nr:hypothetical protein M514_10802 [Trichuris suis]